MLSSYDLEDSNLKDSIINNFKKDGFIYLPGFLNDKSIEEIKRKVEVFIATKMDIMPKEQVYFEDKADKNTLKQLQELYKYDDFFNALMFDSVFEKLASVLLEDQVTGKNLQYFNKPPGIGQATPAHQDGFYFNLVPNEAVTMWLALDHVDEENGCIRYIRKSQLNGMRPHGKTGVLGFSQGINDFGTDEDLENEVFFIASPGDLLVHHSLTIHRADNNKSKDRSRKALGFIYYAERAKEDKAAHEAYQNELAKNLQASRKI